MKESTFRLMISFVLAHSTIILISHKTGIIRKGVILVLWYFEHPISVPYGVRNILIYENNFDVATFSFRRSIRINIRHILVILQFAP